MVLYSESDFSHFSLNIFVAIISRVKEFCERHLVGVKST